MIIWLDKWNSTIPQNSNNSDLAFIISLFCIMIEITN